MNRRALFGVAADAVAALALAAAPALSMRRTDIDLPKIDPYCRYPYRESTCRHRLVQRFETGRFTQESAAQIQAMFAKDVARMRFST